MPYVIDPPRSSWAPLLLLQQTARPLRYRADEVAHLGVLGLEVRDIEEIPSEGVKVALIPFDGGEIELLEPTDADTPVGRFLAKHGEGLHHVSFDVPDVHKAILAGIEHGVETVGEAPRMGAGGREIAFFHPLFTHGVLIEVAGHAQAPAARSARVDPEIAEEQA